MKKLSPIVRPNKKMGVSGNSNSIAVGISAIAILACNSHPYVAEYKKGVLQVNMVNKKKK